MKSFYLPVLILSALVSAALALGAVTEKQSVYWEDLSHAAEQAALAEDWDAAEEQLAALEQSWESWQLFLHITLPHDHINDTDQKLKLSLHHASNRDTAHLCESLTELKSAFRILSDQGELSFHNLL